MRKFWATTIIYAGLYTGALWGQATNIFNSTGNVGIGTVTPNWPLQILSNSSPGIELDGFAPKTSSAFMRFFSGEGSSSSPAAITSGDQIGGLSFGGYYTGKANPYFVKGDARADIVAIATENWLGANNNGTAIMFSTTQNGTGLQTERMRIDNNGNIGIGTTTPQQLLDVAGTMAAREVIVSTTGADYIFDPNYHLAPLAEVGQYIQDHHHLPDIPSAAEVKEKGIKVGEMDSKLLAKIEELTLHMIQSEERNRELEERIAKLESQLNQKETH